MILGVDARTSREEDADHLAHQVREVVGRVLGAEAAGTAVLATHGVGGSDPRTVVSCTVPGNGDAGGDGEGRDEAALVEGSSTARPVDRLVAAVAALLDGRGAVVGTCAGLPDGLSASHDPVALGGAWAAVAAAATRTSGRLVHAPGQDRLVGRLSVAQILTVGGIHDVHLLGGGTLPGATVVDTRGFVRPRVQDGRVRLLVQPAAHGVMVPFEREDPHRCCADH